MGPSVWANRLRAHPSDKLFFLIIFNNILASFLQIGVFGVLVMVSSGPSQAPDLWPPVDKLTPCQQPAGYTLPEMAAPPATQISRLAYLPTLCQGTECPLLPRPDEDCIIIQSSGAMRGGRSSGSRTAGRNGAFMPPVSCRTRLKDSPLRRKAGQALWSTILLPNSRRSCIRFQSRFTGRMPMTFRLGGQ